jgi:hypothetical protein
MAQAKRHEQLRTQTVAVMITAKEIEYLLQLCLDLHEKEADGYAFSIDLLLKGLSREQVRAVASASVDLLADDE